MPFDYKKEFKDLYLPSKKPQLVTVPKMNFLAVRGKGGYKIADFFDYVVPPLEGFWWQEKENSALAGFDYSDKSSLKWISVIRLPDFVTLKNFEWAKEKADNKKGLDCSKAEMLSFEEGLCVQIMHIGSYDDEPASVKEMHDFASQEGWQLDFSATRLHHEIYLSDPRKTAPEKLRTIIRHPVRKI